MSQSQVEDYQIKGEKTELKGEVEFIETLPSKHVHLKDQLKSELDSIGLWDSILLYKKTVIICLLGGFVASTDGYQNTLSSSVISNKGFIKQFSGGQKAINPTYVSSFGGIFSAGQVVGQFTIQWMSDWKGRKVGVFTFIFILVLAVIVESVSSVWWHWTIAKLLAGIGIGACQATLPVYVNEHAPSQMRGFLVVAYSLWWSFGGLAASIGLTKMANDHPLDYKTPIYTQFGMLGLSFLVFLFLPESPWYLASKGKMAEAEKILQYKYANVPGYDIPRELKIISSTIEQQRLWDMESAAQGPLAIFKGKNGIRFLSHLGQKSFSSFYFFQIAGSKNPFNATIILGCVSLLSVCFDAVLVDKIGRRRMTLIGFTGACVGVILMAIVGCFDYTKPSLGATLVFAGAFANFFNTFQSSTSYAYLTEIPEQRFKARSTGWGLAYCNLYAVIFAYTVPLMLKKWVVKTAFLFVGLGVPGTVLAFFIMPETSQRSPAEIQELFVTNVPLTKWRGYKTDVEIDLEERKRAAGAGLPIAAVAA